MLHICKGASTLAIACEHPQPSVDKVVLAHNLHHHQYADDTQVYMASESK